MSPAHTVQQGDCLSSIASSHGLPWQTVWKANSDLQAKRKDPNVLFPGDVVTIPESTEGEEACQTDKRHTFRKQSDGTSLSIVVQDDGEPIADTPYILTVDGKKHEGTSDSEGKVEHDIPSSAREGTLEIKDLIFELELGSLDPIDVDTGAQARLQNLGYYDGAIDGQVGEVTKEGLIDFQGSVGLKPTGELDDATRKQLLAWQDEAKAPAGEAGKEVPEPDEKDEQLGEAEHEEEEERPDEGGDPEKLTWAEDDGETD